MWIQKRQLRRFVSVFLAALILAIGFAGFHNHRAYALDNGLAKTPPMGYNDWNAFGCNVSAKLIKESAKAMVDSGMKAAGYKYVNIDDCWMKHSRDANGNLVPDPQKFPNGMKAVADYVHSLGLKIGIYESAGTTTCAGYPGSIGHEKQDAETFAKWGIDYLKYDNCGDHLGQSLKQRYTAMRDALAATGRDIVFSMCEWGNENPSTWAGPIANLWRTTGDINDSYGSMVSIFHQNVGLYAAAGPGHWNDPDMLEIGNGGMSLREYRTEFSLWSEMAAPLLAGTDLRNMSDAIKHIYTNRKVIAVDQDPLGKQGKPVQSNKGHWVLTKPLANGERAVVLFNETDQAAAIHTTVKQVGLGHASPAYLLHNLWTDKVTETTGNISATVPAHGVVMYRVSRGTPDQAPPNVSLSVDTPSLAIPGKTTKIQVKLANNGRIAASNVQASLDVPKGWTVQPSAKQSLGTMPPAGPKQSKNLTWELNVPKDTKPGTKDLTAHVTYTYGDDNKTAELQAPISIQIPPPAPTDNSYVSDLPFFGTPQNGWGPVERDMSNGETAKGDGHTITLNGVTYNKGLGVHAPSKVSFFIGGGFSKFVSDIGLDDEKDGSPGSVVFQVWGDGKKLYDSGLMLEDSATKHVSVDISGVNVLTLVVTDGGNGNNSDHSDWAGAQILK